ncbi:glycoside hydrolase family 76 protein [Sinomonas susongensis]|uniref:glycoside hydrolase family 76 protein n=1 Tax=Sinomonas susongensis TaxID=1324851 RepID=UPI001109E4CD|nr:glycoside hydrolase family 76 protein [Sinomonas susongensis]
MSTPETAAARASVAAKSVTATFGHAPLRVGGAWLAWVQDPHRRPQLPWSEWHYWWQAHLLDCLVDAAEREAAGAEREAAGDEGEATGAGDAEWAGDPSWLLLGQRHLRGIRLRNFGRFPNMFFDDMAWLALASQRAEALARKLTGQGLPPAGTAVRELKRRLVAAQTDDLGGGMFWNTRRRYKNTATAGPAAVFFARAGDHDRAQSLVDWLCETLFDPAQGLFLDGIDVPRNGGEPSLTRDVWAYNQGTVLGALVELGDYRPANLERAAALVDAVDRGLTVPVPRLPGAAERESRALKAHGDGDGGLFMGILARYLALAARDPRLPGPTRDTARRLVVETADAIWAGREERAGEGAARGLGLGHSNRPSVVFPAHPGELASSSYPERDGQLVPVELGTQVQAWTLFEASYRVLRTN